MWNQSVVPCPVLTVASWPAYRFLKRHVRWPGIPIPFRIFHSWLWSTQSKAFGIVNKAEIDVFLELFCFFYDPADVGNSIFGSSAISKPAWTSGSSRFMYCWSLACRILSITLLVCEMSAIVRLEFLKFFPWNQHQVHSSSGPLSIRSSKVMLKILQARLQQYMNPQLPDVQAGFRKGRGTRDKIVIIWKIDRSFIKKSLKKQ